MAAQVVKSKPDVSLVVPVHNELKYTKLMMESFRKHTHHPSLELIFVDNGSAWPTRHYLESQPDIDMVIHFSDNVGFPAGVNAGIEQSRGEIVGILNNDILLSHNWLEKMLSALETYPALGIVSPLRTGRIENFPGVLPFQFDGRESPPDSSFSRETDIKRLTAGMDTFVDRIEKEYAGEVCFDHTMIPFCCALIRHKVFDKVGLLDEDFGIGLVEDTHFCHLALRAGFALGSCLDNYAHHFMSRTLFTVLGGEEAAEKQARLNHVLASKKEAALEAH